uniref:Uncharacterized protein n=1 Tax=Romanomermis culicivorax TaxID=13658 RepID=A0A915IEM2_ROMCU
MKIGVFLAMWAKKFKADRKCAAVLSKSKTQTSSRSPNKYCFISGQISRKIFRHYAPDYCA